MRGKIFYHGACFDGATSAALFAAFYRARHKGAEIAYRAMDHCVGDPFDGVRLDGDDNICLDFRYCADPAMTWWFDHHVSAFQPRELRTDFEERPSDQKVFDPEARSCAILVHRTLKSRFGFEFDGELWADLVAWADKIDGAVFDSAEEAVLFSEPALEITTWLAHTKQAARTDELIQLLGQRPLSEIASLAWLRRELDPVLSNNRRMIDLIKERSTVSDGVVRYDLAGDGIAAHNKFIAYMLFPESRYTVGVTCSATQAKVSVGNNPWSSAPREHNIALICERFGGGGHPVVGGVSLDVGELPRIREIAAEIAKELSSDQTSV